MTQDTAEIPPTAAAGVREEISGLALRGDAGECCALDVVSRVHLLLCTNADYLQHVAVCLTSLLVNNPHLFFDVVVVGRTSERLDEERLRRSLAQFPNQSLTFKQFTPPAHRILPLNPGAHYTLDTWTRLWVADFFPPEVKRVLYLDGDIVVLGDVAPLWRTELDGAILPGLETRGLAERVAELGVFAGCHRPQHVPGGVELLEDPGDARQHLEGGLQLIVADCLDGGADFVDGQLHPEFGSLVLDDEQ